MTELAQDIDQGSLGLATAAKRDLATGIRRSDSRKAWLVPPWPLDAAVHEVARHFSRYRPWSDAGPAEWVAYYRGFAAALTAARAIDVLDGLSRRWYEELLGCVTKCAINAEAEREAAGDPQEDEDENVKEVKEKTGAK